MGVLAVSFTGRERSFPDRFSKKVFGSGCIWSWPGGVRNLREPRCGHQAFSIGHKLNQRLFKLIGTRQFLFFREIILICQSIGKQVACRAFRTCVVERCRVGQLPAGHDTRNGDCSLYCLEARSPQPLTSLCVPRIV